MAGGPPIAPERPVPQACRSRLSHLGESMAAPVRGTSLRAATLPLLLRQTGDQASSNFSMRSVSASPSRVHSWNAGSACIVSI